MRFKITIEIELNSDTKKWRIFFLINSVLITIPMFFVENHEIDFEEDQPYQLIEPNKILLKKIEEMLKCNVINIIINQDIAYELYHYFVYNEFQNKLHPLYQVNTHFKLEYEGTQEQIYQKIKFIEEKYLDNFFKNNKIS